MRKNNPVLFSLGYIIKTGSLTCLDHFYSGRTGGWPSELKIMLTQSDRKVINLDFVQFHTHIPINDNSIVL